jgi:tRNA(fMet)-specific endonuclease VapC
MLVWGDLTGQLENEGKPLAAIDSLIAAIALQGHYSLITRNDSDFQHTGVTVINPWKEAQTR